MSRKTGGKGGSRTVGRPPESGDSGSSSERISEADRGRLGWILLAVVTVLSSGLVAGAFMPAPHTGGDNAAYLTLAYSLLQGQYAELFDPAGLPHTKYPPVFPGLLALLMAAGFRTWTAFKSVAALSTVAVAVLTYLWSRQRLGVVWGAAVALLVASSSAVVFYSHWILSDPTFVALTLLALWGLERSDEDGAGAGWLVLGVGAAGLAYFTRSAGIPLVVALASWLVLGRRWRAVAATGVALGVPMVLWLLRARGAGQGEYVSEFWLVNPYAPSEGTVGVVGLFGRLGINLVGYVGSHIPGGIVGGGLPGAGFLGVVLVVGAAVGWGLTVRKRVGPTELFVPLYFGLILLWPAIWSGDRFALPLYPLLFFYGAVALKELGRARGQTLGTAAAAAVFLAFLLPAGGAWVRAAGETSACSAAVKRSGPFACYGPGVAAFVDAAAWSGANLPEGAAVLTRKPRLFYVLSGVPSRTFPFTDDTQGHMELADALGARYELFDQWDGLAGRYVAGAVGSNPQAFCAVQSFGDGGTVLLGIQPPESRSIVAGQAEVEVRVAPCPTSYADRGGTPYSSSSMRIPLLERLSP